MLSNDTFKLLKIMVTTGYYLGFLPWKWDTKQRCLRRVKSKIMIFRWHFIIWLHLFARISALAHLAFVLAVFDLPMYELAIAAAGGAIFFMSLIFCFVMLREHNYLFSVLNGTLLFDKKHMALHGFSYDQVRKCESDLGMKILLATFTALLFVFPAGIIAMSQMDFNLLWTFKIFRRVFPGFNIFVVFAGMAFISLECFFYAILLSTAYLGSNSLIYWMEHNTWNGPEMATQEMKEKLRVFCRAHLVMVNYLRVIADCVIPPLVATGFTTVIFLLYLILGMHQNFGIATIIDFSIIVGILLLIGPKGCDAAVAWSTASWAYPKSFMSNDKSYSKLDSKFFASVRKVEWRIGPWVKIDQELTPVSVDFVINWTITLLLTFER